MKNKNKFKKATLTTLSGVIVASNMPLNVFAYALTNELSNEALSRENTYSIESNDEDKQILDSLINNEVELELEDASPVIEDSDELEETTAEDKNLEDLEESVLVIEESIEPEDAVLEDVESSKLEEALLEEPAVSENDKQEGVALTNEKSVDKTQVVIDIPDANLKKGIRRKLMKLTGDITQADMERLTELDVNGRGVSDLTGLEYAVNLCALDLSYNQIDDISILSGLINLESLALDGNQISDISALSGMTNLIGLALEYNQISDISALSGLSNLRSLALEHNKISDISALSGLVNLKNLWLENNQISDISALSGLTKLQELYLDSNQISDISALSGLTNLRFLGLGYNEVSNISVLSGLSNLRFLGLGYNEVSNISVLSGLSNLTILGLEYNQISDISALSGLVNLKNLWLENNQISDISALSGLTNLVDLELSNNQISNISALKGARSLSELHLSDNKISDESLNELIETLPQLIELAVSFDEELNLSTLTKLESLYIVNSVINDFSELKINSPLDNLKLISCEVMDWDSIKTLDSLRILSIEKMEVPDYEILKELPNLVSLYLFDNDILDLSQFNKMWYRIVSFIYDQHTKLDVELVDNKIENPFIDINGSYIKKLDLPEGVTLSDDGAYLIFDNPVVGESYEFTAKSYSYQFPQVTSFLEPVELKATFTITASKKTGGELTVEENTLSNFDKELQIEIKDAVHEIERIILPDGTEVQGNTATYVVKESGDYTIKYIDVQGNEFTQTITVKVDKPVIDKPSTGDSDANKPNASVNQAPVILASNISIPVGYNLDLMSLATATDKEDGELDVKIISSNFDNTKPGVYNVTYQATDSKGLSTTKTIHIMVRDLSEGNNPYTKDIVIAPNEELDIESIVNEIAKDKGLTDVEILENNVDTSKPGDYGVVFEGTNAQKEQEIHSIKVTVMAEVSSDKEDDSSSMNNPSGESVETGLTSGATITLGGLFTLAGIPFLKRKRK